MAERTTDIIGLVSISRVEQIVRSVSSGSEALAALASLPLIPPPSIEIPARLAALQEVMNELLRQDEKWGEQNHPDGTGPEKTWLIRIDGDESMAMLRDIIRRNVDLAHRDGEGNWLGILLEEVVESFAEDDPQLLRTELLQVAAVAVQWVLAIDRRRNAPAEA